MTQEKMIVPKADDMIVRHARSINRSISPQASLDATGRHQQNFRNATEHMPREGREEDEVFFFQLGRYIDNDKLAIEYELRGLKPDPYAQIRVNMDDLVFADKYVNVTHWKDPKGRWCHMMFYRYWPHTRTVNVDLAPHGFSGDCWFAGVRK